MGEGKSSGFGSSARKGKSARNWGEVLKDLKQREIQRVRIFLTGDLPS